ncbi:MULTISPECIES: type II toxin-antitoxin system Phd/YefM family antitoxin [Lacticaseibacillus]|uniref:Antitoxin n=2 Tax=Lacticaseibacillus TaxID=2759736 RepID=A0AAN1F0J7_LACCA|nr:MULTISPECIES: type II toxin-antitoxin system Phd/YefM family antitoxin [Lacticaseibacillus]ARY92569.1 prevent-host-death protein [Lacticaseibacillus casei]KAB1969590.1 type II toxin-antitoxin system Phd/YefM family antitoxin [Lacticaseibacillus casei]WLV80470.1 type II toxin-antitoxin system Phd/YefM family antitoxin [Lacticaseibacillus sp. NCIMB 15473]WNX24431.1 type II toxin-antitoxin system Phd/YefM family antitoxin [Lacticaseibacillus casei]WNX27203.1 type II toxin-antitoxin system Phd/
MDAVSYSVFRRNLKHYLQAVNDDATPLLITSRDNAADTAVLMNKRDFDAMQETMRILSNPELMAKIRRGQAQIAAGKTRQHDLKDVGGGDD